MHVASFWASLNVSLVDVQLNGLYVWSTRLASARAGTNFSSLRIPATKRPAIILLLTCEAKLLSELCCLLLILFAIL